MRLYPLLFLSVGRAVPGSTCCRSAGPTATCCRRTEHEFGDHKLKSPNSPVFRDSPENTCRRCRPRLGEAPLRFALPQTPTEVCPVGRADYHLLPVGRADGHSLPPVLSTTVGRHKLKRPRSARVNPAARAAGTSPFRGGVSHRVQGSPEREAVAEGDGGVS